MFENIGLLKFQHFSKPDFTFSLAAQYTLGYTLIEQSCHFLLLSGASLFSLALLLLV